MAHALIAHKLAAMAAIEERAKKLKKMREQNSMVRAIHGKGKLQLNDELSKEGDDNNNNTFSNFSKILLANTNGNNNNNNNNNMVMHTNKDGNDNTNNKMLRPQVKAALNALIVEKNNDPNNLTVGDVFKAIESLRTRRLQSLSNIQTNDKYKVKEQLSTTKNSSEIFLNKRSSLLSNSDGQNNDNDNNNTTMLLLKKVKTTHDKKINANKLTKDGESNNNWVRKKINSTEVKNRFTFEDVEQENKVQWKEKTRNIAGREDGMEIWKSDADHSINAVYANHDCVFLGLGSGKIVVLSPDGELRLTILGHTGYISALTGFGQLLFSGSLDGTVRLWIYHKGEQMAMSAGHIGPVHCLHYQQKTKTLFSGSSDRTIRKWFLTEGKSEILVRFEQGEGVFAIDEGLRNILVVGLENGVVSFVDIESGTATRALEGHTDIVASVNVHRETKTVASGSRDGTCRIWFAGRTSIVYTKHKEAVYKVKLVQNGQQCISCSGDQSIHRWNVVDGTCMSIYLGIHAGTIFSFDFCHGNMYSGDRQCKLLKWHAAVQCEFCEPKCNIGCKYRMVTCPHKLCDLEISENELNNHIKECPKRLVKCRNKECKYNVRADAMNLHVKKNCIYTYIDCPNIKTCGQRIQRKDLSNHLSYCNEHNIKKKAVVEKEEEITQMTIDTTVVEIDNNNHTKESTDYIVKNVKQIKKIKKSTIRNKNSRLPSLSKPKKRVVLPKKQKDLPRVWRPGK